MAKPCAAATTRLAKGRLHHLQAQGYRQWSMYAFDFSEKPVVGKRSREWTAVGQTGLHCVQETARCLDELKVGRWPK